MSKFTGYVIAIGGGLLIAAFFIAVGMGVLGLFVDTAGELIRLIKN